MPIPTNITKEHLIKAVEKIDHEGIPKDGDSKYYDAVYNGKKYPPKLIVSYANLFANGYILNRNSFEGGSNTPCFKLLNVNGFKIERKMSEQLSTPKVWFVTQGATFNSETGMQFLFAPSEGKDGTKRFYWDNVLNVKKGDIIFNYSEGIKGVSIAKSDGRKFINGDPNLQWQANGYRVDIDLTPLSPTIDRLQLLAKKELLFKYLDPIINKPFNINGKVNQGYLYEFTEEAGRLIREIYGKQFGNEYIDDFFDRVDFPEIKNPIISIEVFNYNKFYNHLLDANCFANKKLCCRFISSLLTKPFVILTGLSGSGKTKIAQAFSMWLSESDNQYCIVPVGSDWTNREPLLGFPNALEKDSYILPENGVLRMILEASKNENKNKPYFLILDEMNLSHVERYFADFLSLMESKDDKGILLHSDHERKDSSGNMIPKSVHLPRNLFIIGTVNIDETTYMFSPKVLDRANVIEFSVTIDEMNSYFESNTNINLEILEGLGSNMASNFVEIACNKNVPLENNDELKIALMKFFAELKKTGAEFGYRSASEILRFSGIVNKIEPEWKMSEIIDAAIMQKLLPKVHGSRRKLEPVLKTLGTLCLLEGQNLEDYIKTKDHTIVKYPISLEKILRMNENLISNGFTSYAEA